MGKVYRLQKWKKYLVLLFLFLMTANNKGKYLWIISSREQLNSIGQYCLLPITLPTILRTEGN